MSFWFRKSSLEFRSLDHWNKLFITVKACRSLEIIKSNIKGNCPNDEFHWVHFYNIIGIIRLWKYGIDLLNPVVLEEMNEHQSEVGLSIKYSEIAILTQCSTLIINVSIPFVCLFLDKNTDSLAWHREHCVVMPSLEFMVCLAFFPFFPSFLSFLLPALDLFSSLSSFFTLKLIHLGPFFYFSFLKGAFGFCLFSFKLCFSRTTQILLCCIFSIFFSLVIFKYPVALLWSLGYFNTFNFQIFAGTCY